MHAQAAVDTAAKEIRALSLALLRGVENPELFPPHVQRLHALGMLICPYASEGLTRLVTISCADPNCLTATKVQEERARRGIPQNAIDARSFPLENAQRVVYAVYDRRSPQLFYLASREPPGIDLRGLFLMSLRNRNNKLLDYLAR